MPISKATRSRLWAYGTLLACAVGFYFYQPIRIDFFPKPPPVPNPIVDPDSKALFSPGARIMVVTAHPDDSEYYLGPFLLRLAQTKAHVDLVVCTDGDKSYYPWQNGGSMRRIRQGEQMAAAKVWNASTVTFLGFPDGRLHLNDDVVADIRAQIQEKKPAWLIAFDGVYPPKVSHGDHRSSGQAAVLAAAGTSVKFELLFDTHAPNYFADTSQFESRERELLALHGSEFTGGKLDRVETTVEADASEAGDRLSTAFGVAFRCARL